MTYIPRKMHAVLQKENRFANDALPASQLRNMARYIEQANIDLPTPGPDQVLIKVVAAMINSSDLALIQGGYSQPRIKGAPSGFEGIGEVVSASGDYGQGLVGKWVAFVIGQSGSGARAEFTTADAATVIPLRPDLKKKDAAALIVNPLTAVTMVELVPDGGAFVASGSASQRSKLMASLAKDTGKRMIALVRREDPIQTLKALDASHVFNDTNKSFAANLNSVRKAERPTVFLDCIAGSVSAWVFSAMGKDGSWVIYGEMTTEPSEILEPVQLISMRKKVMGFLLVSWMQQTDLVEKMKAIQLVQARCSDGCWSPDISARVTLHTLVEQLPAALNMPDRKSMVKIG